MMYFSSFKMSFILAASLAIVANTSVIKRAEGSIISASSVGAAQGESKKVADLKFVDRKFARCVREMGRTYVKDLQALHCNKRGISDVSGIEQLKALRVAHFHDNELTTIDTSGNKHLFALYANNNQLASVDVSQNSKLRRLFLANNDLLSLDVSQNRILEVLLINNNALNTLKINTNRVLKELAIDGNNIRRLRLDRNPELAIFKADENDLQELDFSNNPKLQYVSVIDNNLLSIKTGKNDRLSVLRAIYNPLSVVNINNNNRLKTLSFNRAVKCRGEKCKIATHERPRLIDIDFKDSSLSFCIAETHPNAMYVDQIKALDCSSRGIMDSDGLEQLTALTSLNLRNNSLSKIDLRQMLMLKELSLLRNQLTSINVTNNKKLTRLVMGSNALKRLDVSHNSKLEQLLINGNRLKKIDLSKNEELMSLFALDNPMAEIDLTLNNAILDVKLPPVTVCYGAVCPTYLVKGQSGANGSISPKESYITHGHNAYFVISPNTGYSISYLNSVGCEGTLTGRLFTTEKIAGYCAVYVGFERTNISHIDFQDENMRDCVIAQHGEDELVENVSAISCANKGIFSTKGLEHFTNLTQLMLRSNQISEIDVSTMPKLNLLSLLNNQLTSLDVTNNRNLERLTLGGNMLNTLDTSNNERLSSLFINGNPISQLDLANNFSLVRLFALDTELDTLDLSNNILIEDLRIESHVMCTGQACSKR